MHFLNISKIKMADVICCTSILKMYLKFKKIKIKNVFKIEIKRHFIFNSAQFIINVKHIINQLMLSAKREVFGKNKWTIIILKGYVKYKP